MSTGRPPMVGMRHRQAKGKAGPTPPDILHLGCPTSLTPVPTPTRRCQGQQEVDDSKKTRPGTPGPRSHVLCLHRAPPCHRAPREKPLIALQWSFPHPPSRVPHHLGTEGAHSSPGPASSSPGSRGCKQTTGYIASADELSLIP